MTAPARHLDALTGLRGIAAWLVVLYHIRLSLLGLLPSPVIAVLAKGYLAVDLFFMLSGFVLWFNYADRLRAGGGAMVRQFLWRRFARVWPLHAVILSAYLGFVGLLFLTGRSLEAYPLAQLPLHLLLVQNWGFTSELTWNHPAWSISAEFAAYLIFPLIVLTARWDKWSPRALLLLAATLVMGLYALFVSLGHRTLGEAIPQLGLLRCLIGFALGNVLCVLWLQLRLRTEVAWLAALSCGAILELGWAFNLAEALVVPAACFTGLLALASAGGLPVRLLGGRTLTYLGEISYSTYLGHFLLWTVWKILFVDASLQIGAANLAGFLGAVLGLSALLYHGVEKPAQRWLNAHPPRWATRFSATPAE